MAECLISWMIIFVTAYLWGNVSLCCLKRLSGRLADKSKKEKINWKIDDCVIAGMCLLTVYAQAFSIFYKVGAIALLLVIAFDIVFFLAVRIKLVSELKSCFLSKDKELYFLGG